MSDPGGRWGVQIGDLSNPGAGKAAEKAKDQSKKRVKKDKDAPKKPMSPFFCYQAVRRPQIKTDKPTLNNNEIIKVTKLTPLSSPAQVPAWWALIWFPCVKIG